MTTHYNIVGIYLVDKMVLRGPFDLSILRRCITSNYLQYPTIKSKRNFNCKKHLVEEK